VSLRILVIEDDAVLREVLCRSLASSGHRVDPCDNLADAAIVWRHQSFDAVLLDLNLPTSRRVGAVAGSGLDLLREARQRGDRTPVLVLTARNRTDERIEGLNAGADDYLGKPFELDEVDARLRALVRRARSWLDDVQEFGMLRLEREHRRFSLAGEELVLPSREFQVLWELMSPAGRVLSKSDLAAKLSELDDLLAPNALEAFISRLRKKLAGSGVGIRTLRGLGYQLTLGET
jgi:DNA-binding response OmpR family regulator